MPKHLSNPLVSCNPHQVECECHYRVMNLVSNIQDFGQVHFGAMGLYKSQESLV